MNHGPGYTLIGDMVDSRNSPDRADLQENLRLVLERLNSAEAGPRMKQPLASTVGDEFQGVFADLSAAVGASLLVRLELLKATGTDCRCGLGFGPVEIYDEQSSPRLQDGPGWWAARRSIEEVHELAQNPRTAFLRTRFRFSDEARGTGGAEESALNAFLVMRDSVVAQMKPRSRRILLGFLRGKPQVQIAQEESMTQSNVSQNLSRNGAHSIKLAQDQLEGSGR